MDEPDRERAIHEMRKSIRRARALVRLLPGPMGEKKAKRLDRELRTIMRPTSELRDTDVLLASLDELLPTKVGESAQPLRELLIKRQREQRQRVAAVLAEAATALEQLPGKFEKRLPAGLGRKDLLRCLKQSFKRCRQARREAVRQETDDALHDWRKRVKELRYQVELVGDSAAGKASKKARQALAGLAKTLGGITDQCVLKDDLTTYRDDLGEDPEAWLDELRERIRVARLEVIEDSADLFEAGRPREFAQAVLGNVA